MRLNNLKKLKYNKDKIIHIDMDCFYASVEIRDKPQYAKKPVAVAGSSESRGVVTTCNYIARKFGVRSAMPSMTAKKLCPEIVFLPVNMYKYREVSAEVHKIYKCYTKIIEPVSLDEAYLDVTTNKINEQNSDKRFHDALMEACKDNSINETDKIISWKKLVWTIFKRRYVQPNL